MRTGRGRWKNARFAACAVCPSQHHRSICATTLTAQFQDGCRVGRHRFRRSHLRHHRQRSQHRSGQARVLSSEHHGAAIPMPKQTFRMHRDPILPVAAQKVRMIVDRSAQLCEAVLAQSAVQLQQQAHRRRRPSRRRIIDPPVVPPAAQKCRCAAIGPRSPSASITSSRYTPRRCLSNAACRL